MRRAASTVAAVLALALVLGRLHRATRRSVGAGPRARRVGRGGLDRLHGRRPAQINRQLPESLTRPSAARSRCRRTGTPRTTARPSTSRSCGCARTRQTRPDRLDPDQPRRAGRLRDWPSCRTWPPDILNLATRFDLVTFDPRGVGQSGLGQVHRRRRPRRELRLRARPGQPTPTFDGRGRDLPAHRRGLLGQVRRAAHALLHRAGRPRHGRDPAGARRGEARLPRLLVRHPARRGLRPAVPRPRSGRWCSTARSTRSSRRCESSEGQAMGFERALTNFAAWCKPERPPLPDRARTPAAAIEQAIASAADLAGPRRRRPAWPRRAGSSTRSCRPCTTSRPGRTSPAASPTCGRGDPTVTFLLADSYADRDANGDYGNLFDANNAVNCADSRVVPDGGADPRPCRATGGPSTRCSGRRSRSGMLNCAVWPAKKDPYPVGPATGAPPIVVVGTIGRPGHAVRVDRRSWPPCSAPDGC